MRKVFATIIGIFLFLGVAVAEKASVRDRIANRSHPSIVMPWHFAFNLPTISGRENAAMHDLIFSPQSLLRLEKTEDGIEIVGDFEFSSEEFNEYRANPNIVMLLSIPFRKINLEDPYNFFYRDIFTDDFPWVRDASGNIATSATPNERLIDFTHPRVQEMLIQLAVAVANSEFYDGIFIDYWHERGLVLGGHKTHEEELTARIRILEGIRDSVGDEFLILVNGRPTVTAPYINGIFIESYRAEFPDNFGYESMKWFENTLLWAENNLQEPRINCLEAEGIGMQTPKSPENLQSMRCLTTLYLTHSDGYFLYTMGVQEQEQDHPHDSEFYNPFVDHAQQHAERVYHFHHHAHYWYDFWDADLGSPVGAKGQLYKNRRGLFIREFTNGWAVYNRSGRAHNIKFPEKVSAVTSGREDKYWHEVPDLDGEIFLRQPVNPMDINADGIVNILDLVIVANAFGQQHPDVNGDGTVNILDLTAVAISFMEN